MTPGPVSDSYDPEFGSREVAREVEHGIQRTLERINITYERLGLGEREDIVQVLRRAPSQRHAISFTERDLRVIRFALYRAIETL